MISVIYGKRSLITLYISAQVGHFESPLYCTMKGLDLYVGAKLKKNSFLCIVFLSVQYLNYISIFQLIALN